MLVNEKVSHIAYASARSQEYICLLCSLQMLSADELTSQMGVNVLPPIPPAARMAVMSTPEKREFLETVMAMINSPSRTVSKQLERLVLSIKFKSVSCCLMASVEVTWQSEIWDALLGSPSQCILVCRSRLHFAETTGKVRSIYVAPVQH